MSKGKGKEVLRMEDLEIDGVPTRVVVTTYYESQLGGRIVHHQAFAQISDVVFSVSGIAGWERRAEWLTVFDQALRSIRFILV